MSIQIPLDGAGYEVSVQRAAGAVKQFAELWATGKFDRGPQDYEFMARECIRQIERS